MALSLKEHLKVNGAGHLTLHGVDLAELAGKYGTPLFVFDEATLVGNFERFKRAFESLYPKVLVCYSVKTNNNLAICRILREKGAYAEVSSTLDLHIALKAGFPGERIIYDGPFKPADALEKAVKEHVLLINCESLAELERLNSVAEKLGVIQPVGLRVNPFKRPNFWKSLHPKILLEEAAFCFPSCRFGFSLSEIREAFKALKDMSNLRLECLMAHPYHNAVDVLMPLFKEACRDFGFEVKYLNVGGGFNPGTTSFAGDLLLALDYVKNKLRMRSSLDNRKTDKAIETVARDVVEKVKLSIVGLSKPALITEPGGFIVGPSGLLLIRVDHVKSAAGFKWVVVDGGTNILPSFLERREILVVNNGHNSDMKMVNIVGPLLYPRDFVAIKAWLPKVHEGDIIAVLDCGAYSLSSSTQFLYPRPCAILIDSFGKTYVIRERETLEDVLGKDRLF
ncbi:MAG: alanine racemase [Candidatus Bathyarchaeia archaeon]